MDGCECNQKCQHGDTCLGGHANYPDLHWYICIHCAGPEPILLQEPTKEQRKAFTEALSRTRNSAIYKAQFPEQRKGDE
jgi:hypothetical protein